MDKEAIHITTERAKAEAINKIANLPTDGRYEVVISETSKTRTNQQNRSLHLYLNMMSLLFSDAGIDQAMTFEKFKRGFHVPVTSEFLKTVFQTISSDMYGTDRTSKLTTKQIKDVYEVFNAGMGQKFGISAPWPSKEE